MLEPRVSDTSQRLAAMQTTSPIRERWGTTGTTATLLGSAETAILAIGFVWSGRLYRVTVRLI
jgi:hypothetical protein